jgi:hypothetical protein
MSLRNMGIKNRVKKTDVLNTKSMVDARKITGMLGAFTIK